ncbi:hypothetical protein Pcinc_041893 [Petrolisthes cinctipes]|uniref:Uncharacterized protein n=1 Tax=Petrolisthes cinctipes TaxID=88211 RepID=A0AAE1EHC6_PETCI|nr:hypothetical protein Pcinc_041893 [Petrolisthes cinctipes]
MEDNTRVGRHAMRASGCVETQVGWWIGFSQLPQSGCLVYNDAFTTAPAVPNGPLVTQGTLKELTIFPDSAENMMKQLNQSTNQLEYE